MAVPSCTVSVVIPNYNHGRFLRQSLGALLAQTLPPRRILVLNDGSTDDSVKILTELAALHPSIDARLYPDNRGFIPRLLEIMGELDEDYILFAAADDVVLPTLLEKSCALLERHKAAGLCSADILMIDETGKEFRAPMAFRPLAQPGFIAPEQARRHLMRDDSWFWGNTAVYRREALAAVGGFCPNLEGFTDGYACRAIAMKFGVCYSPEVLGYWRRMKGGVASNTTGLLERGVRVGMAAEALMRGRDRDIFPPRYVERWKRRWLMMLIDGQCSRPMPERMAGLRAVWSSPSAFDRFFLWLAARLPVAEALHRLLVLAYAYCHLTPFDVPMTIRQRIGHQERERKAKLCNV